MKAIINLNQMLNISKKINSIKSDMNNVLKDELLSSIKKSNETYVRFRLNHENELFEISKLINKFNDDFDDIITVFNKVIDEYDSLSIDVSSFFNSSVNDILEKINKKG